MIWIVSVCSRRRTAVDLHVKYALGLAIEVIADSVTEEDAA